ncbi:Hypp2834 [Branchiostoma lanceolatum]|uniref:Hypp2834 protein n=1 Tax=Branchiostoma lanceolatum TaxID=7740 RepID=A0A8K0EUS0_BRALA|nr:Hypp2834 [Branchiostoma lanceolatum]
MRSAAGKNEQDSHESMITNRRLAKEGQEAGHAVLTPENMAFLQSATQFVMSDEEVDPGGHYTWLVHSPTWRSKRLKKILLHCDTELDKKPSTDRKRTKRVRSSEPCPRPAPAVNRAYLKTEGGTHDGRHDSRQASSAPSMPVLSAVGTPPGVTKRRSLRYPARKEGEVTSKPERDDNRKDDSSGGCSDDGSHEGTACSDTHILGLLLGRRRDGSGRFNGTFVETREAATPNL